MFLCLIVGSPALAHTPAGGIIGDHSLGARPNGALLGTVTTPIADVPRKVQAVVSDAGENAQNSLAANPWIWANAIAATFVLVFLWRKRFFRAGSLSRGRRVADLAWYFWFACAAMVWLSSSVAVGAAASLRDVSLGQMLGSLKAQSVLYLSGYGASLAVGLVLVRLVRGAAPEAGLTAPRKAFGPGVLAFAAAWPLVASAGLLAAFVHRVATGQPPNPVAHDTLKALVENSSNPWAWTLAGLAVIAAPIQEEIVYRAFGQSAILAATGRPWVAVLATSVIFTCAHVVGPQPVPWYAAVAIFTLSVCMGAAFERSKSLIVPILMHILFNATNVAMVVLPQFSQ